MEVVAIAIGGIFVLFYTLWLLFAVFKGLGLIFGEFWYNKVKWQNPVSRSEYIIVNRILSEKFDYYKGLSVDGKAKFINRIIDFRKTKRFIGMEGLKATEEMKTLISGAAVQLTFGLEKYILAHYHTIYIYPSTFYSKLLRKKLKGGTSGSGTISLSWEDFQHGYEVPDDKYNLGLHEMAHALKMDVLKGTDFDDRFGFYLNNWEKVGSKEFQNMQKGEPSFLRKYGGTNMHEFFAVCIEHFFETPQQFAKRLPDIYNHLCVLLNQNLINKKSDYSIQEGFAENINRKLGRIPIPKTIRKNYSHHSWHWSLTILLVGIFLTSWLTPLFISYTDLDFHESVCFYFGAVLLGGVLQYPLIIRRKVMSFGIYLIYLILGFSPTACSSILFLNKQISMGRIEEKHQIISWSYKKDINPFLKGSFVILNLENNAYGYFERARAFEYSTFYTVKSKKNKPDSLTIGFSKGIFGLKAFKENTVSFSLHKND